MGDGRVYMRVCAHSLSLCQPFYFWVRHTKHTADMEREREGQPVVWDWGWPPLLFYFPLCVHSRVAPELMYREKLFPLVHTYTRNPQLLYSPGWGVRRSFEKRGWGDMLCGVEVEGWGGPNFRNICNVLIWNFGLFFPLLFLPFSFLRVVVFNRKTPNVCPQLFFSY
jgi:hypothetical protein